MIPASDFLDRGAPAPGDVIAGTYRVEEILGKGGMGIVVRATHATLGDQVALKFLRGPAARDPAFVERLFREARAARRIKSEHVVRVLDLGTTPGGEPFLVMELLTGADLHEVVRERGPLPVLEAIEYVLQACRALAEAHEQGIVHRDLKPANLFLTRRADGSPLVKVLDFGVAKSMAGIEQSITATGDLLGSPLSMSPEQIRDPRRVDGRSDIWALGTILYRLLTGRAPFADVTAAGSLAKILTEPPPSLREQRPDVSPELERIVFKCLEKRLEDRFQRVGDLLAALAPHAYSATPVRLPSRLTGTMMLPRPAYVNPAYQGRSTGGAGPPSSAMPMPLASTPHAAPASASVAGAPGVSRATLVVLAVALAVVVGGAAVLLTPRSRAGASAAPPSPQASASATPSDDRRGTGRF